MTFFSDYEFQLDLYHNNYVNMQTLAKGIKGAENTGNQKMVELFQDLGKKAIAQEVEIFQAGVKVGGDAKQFLADVLKNYPDMKDSEAFNKRLNQYGLRAADLDLEGAHMMSKISVTKLAITQTAVAAIAVVADYQQASKYIQNESFNYLSEQQKSDYAHVYASAKLLQNATMGLKPELGYSEFRDWALKVNLHEKDWVKLDPTPVTQNNLNYGFPARGMLDQRQEM